MRNVKQAKKRKWWFRLLKALMNRRYPKPKFVYLGEEFPDGSILLSNHEGTDSPLSIEKYLNRSIRMWGTHEMNSGLRMMYHYQSRVYYHEKKHWNLFLARLFCLIASPLTNLFYSGFDLISTYQDGRFVRTVKESYQTVLAKDSVMIFPEDSTQGYLPELESFYSGFVSFADYSLRKGLDVPIVVCYFQKDRGVYVFDKPVYYSELCKDVESKKEIAQVLVRRCNELGKMTFTPELLAKGTEVENGTVLPLPQQAQQASAAKKEAETAAACAV